MTKQLMIYQDAVPISAETHRNVAVRQGGSFGFAAALNSVPLVVAEFAKAAAEYPIVFAGEGANLTPAAVVGLRADENLCVAPDGSWDGAYVPAFLRRYPFVFANGATEGTFTLCIDSAFDGVNEEGKGERLFDSEGNRTQYLNTMLQFASDYQAQHALTRSFTDRLRELDLLEPASATATLPDGSRLSLGGFLRVSTDRLANLDDAAVLDLFRTGFLAAIHAHVASMDQLSRLLAKAERRSAARAEG
ncbi:MAG: SapC family protein [Rhodobacteraceae bacterium]|nr:SapC family protein [Paracoccaceae bacterium]